MKGGPPGSFSKSGLNQHAKALRSGNPWLHAAALLNVSQMNPKQQKYVQAKVQKLTPPPGSQSVAYRNPRQGFKPPKPPQTANAILHQQNKAARLAARAAKPKVTTVADDKQMLRNSAEFFTGYQQLEHPGRDPLGAGLAIAGLLPFGKFGKVAEVLRAGSEEANAARTAEAGIRGAKSVQKGAGLLGDLRGARAAKKAARRGPFRTTVEANQHVLETAKRARQQGFGRLIPKTPILKPGEVTAETGGKAGQLIRQGLHPDFSGMGRYEKVGAKLDNPGIAEMRKAQESARSIERVKRAGAIENASEPLSGVGRHIAAKTELVGKLPTGEFKGFKAAEPHADELINHIYDHPHFQPYEKVRAADAILEGIKGKVPTESDQKLLERAFGKEQATGFVAAIKHGSLGRAVANVLGVPRSIMASGDLSAPFRQGLAAMAAKPDLFFKGFPQMLKGAVSENSFQAAMRSIHEMPEFPLMEKAKLGLTDIGETAKSGAADLNKREEQFVSNLAEQIPGIGHMIRGSDRAYVGFLNLLRARMFATYVHQAAENGWHLNDKLVGDIGQVVNTLTGRGDIGALSRHTASMNALFFSPRLLYSRLNLLGFGGAGKWSWLPGSYYASLEPFARQQALKSAMRLTGTLSSLLFFAHMAGAKVNLDPRNADFGKIRIGNTRIDPAGGLWQPVRLLSQLATGQIVSSTTGKLEYLKGGFAGRSRFDVLQQFLENKLAPAPSALVTALGGNPLQSNTSVKSLADNYLVPLLWQDIAQIYHSTHNAGAAAAYGIPDLFGVGIQNYSGKPTSGSSFGGSGGFGGSGSFGGSGNFGGSSFP